MNSGRNGIVGLFVGFLLGVPVSYFFQSEMIRAKLTLGSYLGHLPQLLSNYPKDMIPPVLLSCAVLGFIGWLVGRKLRFVPE